MDSTCFDRQHGGMTWKQWLMLVAIGGVAVTLAVLHPAGPHPDAAADWRERDCLLYFHAHQLFRRGPSELSAAQLDDVCRWRRCLDLMRIHETSRIDGLSDEQCRFVVQTLPEFIPDLEDYGGYHKIYQSCANRLRGASQPELASVAGSPWQEASLTWE